MSTASLFFEQGLLLHFSSGNFQERAFSVTKRRPKTQTQKEEFILNNHFAILGLGLNFAEIRKSNSTKIELLRTQENQFYFRYLTPLNKRPPYRCIIRIFQNNNEIFSVALTLCSYTVHRDITRIEGIVPTAKENNIPFQLQDIPNSSFAIICEDASYPTIFGGEKMRDNYLFNSLQPQLAREKKEKKKQDLKLAAQLKKNNNNNNNNNRNEMKTQLKRSRSQLNNANYENDNMFTDIEYHLNYFNQIDNDNNNNNNFINNNNNNNNNEDNFNNENFNNNLNNESETENNNLNENINLINNIDQINIENMSLCDSENFNDTSEYKSEPLPTVNQFSFDAKKEVADDDEDENEEISEQFHKIDNNAINALFPTDNENLGEINQNIEVEENTPVIFNRGYFTALLLEPELGSVEDNLDIIDTLIENGDNIGVLLSLNSSFHFL